jgi:hypothetical protein
MTPFELGYSAFLRGIALHLNPFDKESSPVSCKRWTMGWNIAQRDKIR